MCVGEAVECHATCTRKYSVTKREIHNVRFLQTPSDSYYQYHLESGQVTDKLQPSFNNPKQ